MRSRTAGVVAAGAALASALIVGVAAAGTGYRPEVVNEGPAGYWRLGEASGTSAAAEVGGVAGTYTGGVTLGRQGAISADADTAVALDGSNDLVNFGDPATGLFDVGAGDFSVELWLKTSVHAERTVAGKRASSGNYWYLTVTDDSGQVGRLRSAVNVGSLQYAYSSVRVDDGAWHYVVATFDRDSGVQFYVDGAAAGFTARTFTASLDNSGPLQLGKVTGVSYFLGDQDELALYKKLLTAQDVSDHWAAAIAGGTPAQCSDGLNNDGDAWTDYPADPGCTSADDASEDPNPQCSDGSDNDGDTRIDFPNDLGCSSIADNSESPDPAECSDGVDNDGDTKTDFPADPGCTSASDATEAPNPACSDGSDNDGDTLVDHPADPGCASESDDDETDSPPPAGCDRWVATTGSNANPGTSEQPWLTVQHALDTLTASQVACVRSGTYTQNLLYDRALTSFVEIRSEVPQGAILRSATAFHTLRVEAAGSFLRVRGFRFDHAPIKSGGCIDLYGADLEILENEITACGDQGIYTDEGSDRILIARNRISGVGGMRTSPGQSNGIYLQGTDHTVASNLLVDNRYGFGIQVYDFDVRPRILNNTVVNSAHGGIVLGGTTDAVVVGNVVYDNDTFGIDRSSVSNSGCAIHDNLAFANGTNYDSGWPSGCFGADNAVADPLFVDYAARNLRLADGSPGIDTSDSAYTPTAVDGVARPQGAGPDKGAYER